MHKLMVGLAFAGLSVAICPAQQDAAAQVFVQLDTNRDGKLTQTEFTAHPDLTAEVFKAWDADGDKSVSKAEFAKNYGK